MPKLADGRVINAVTPAALTQLGYQQYTVTSSAVALTVPAGAIEAWIQNAGGVTRWRADGTAPTATVGGKLNDGDTVVVRGHAVLTALKVIIGSSTPVLDITYWG